MRPRRISRGTFDGKVLTLADFRGQVLIINFWRPGAAPARRAALLNAYYKAASQHGYGLRVLAVTTEDSLPIETLKPLAAMVRSTWRAIFKRIPSFQTGPNDSSSTAPASCAMRRPAPLRWTV